MEYGRFCSLHLALRVRYPGFERQKSWGLDGDLELKVGFELMILV